MLKKLRSSKIWLPIFIVCFLLIMFKSTEQKAKVQHYETYEYYERDKSLSIPHPAPPPPQQVNYMDSAIKVGAIVGGFLNLANLIEKIVKWIWKRKK